MKELSIEQKAKRYDEIIEKANKMHSENCDACQMCIEELIPELAESEDEKIRKALCKAIWTYVPTEEGQEYIAWLEKQGTPAKLSEEEQNRFAKDVLKRCAMSFIDYLDAHKYEGKMCVSNGECEDIENAFHNAMWDRLHRYYCKYLEKKGEQKCTYQLNNLKSNIKFPFKAKVKSSGAIVTIHDGQLSLDSKQWITYQSDAEDGYTCYEPNDLELVGEQKPAWSEEDKRMIESIIKHLERQKNYQTNTTNIEQCKNWLKSIKDRIQPKQELSENKDFIEFENWFNLYKRKKTWKPTNEQMEILKHFSLNRKMYPILASLYEDLKKL